MKFKLFSRFHCCSLAAAACLSGWAYAAGLPDTGQVLCYDGSEMVACTRENSGDDAPFPGQDGRYGRDPAASLGLLEKQGQGDQGFDYTKICNNGEEEGEGDCPLDPVPGHDPESWGCVRDNITGLMWEVKTDDDGLRDKDWFYSWYDPDGTANGGDAGTPDAGVGDGRDHCFDPSRCDSEKYVADVNELDMCGEVNDDWRVPTKRELESIFQWGRLQPAMDPGHFPNASASYYWSAASMASEPQEAWVIQTFHGHLYGHAKGSYDYHGLRVVRGNPF